MNFLLGFPTWPTFRSESCTLEESGVLKQKEGDDLIIVVYYVSSPFGDFFKMSKHMDSKNDGSDLVV